MARSLSPSPERAKERSRKRERSHSPRDHKKEKKSRKSHKRSRSPREDRSRARAEEKPPKSVQNQEEEEGELPEESEIVNGQNGVSEISAEYGVTPENGHARSKSKQNGRSKSKDRHRSKSRQRARSRSREKGRDKSRERHRSKSRDRHRSRDRKRRSRSREKRRPSPGEKRHRSRSKDGKRGQSREKSTAVGLKEEGLKENGEIQENEGDVHTKAEPLSLDELMKKRKEEEEALAKPKFLSKKERQELALQRLKERREMEKKGTQSSVHDPFRNSSRSANQSRYEAERRAEEGRQKAREEREKEKEDREREKELEVIRKQYLGTEKVKKKIRKPSEKFHLNFDWEATDDTSKDLNPIYNNTHESIPLFGTGRRAGVDIQEQKTQAAEHRNQLQKRLRLAQGLEETEEDRKRDRERRRQAQKYDSQANKNAVKEHWSNKSREEMTERDWRIFREDFNISYKGVNVSGDALPCRNWTEAALPEELMKAIKELGYKKPSPIQMASIPLGLLQRDIIGVAETGSGKTASFVLPMLCYIKRLPVMTEEIAAQGPYAVIMAPVRELAQQIEEEAMKLAKHTPYRTVSVVGGQEISEQAFKLRKGCEIVVATPGRLKDCIDQSYAVLNQCNYVVLDEADRMIDMGFEPQVVAVLDAMPSSNLKPEDEDGILEKDRVYRTTYMFSATMPPPVERLARKYMRRPAVINIGSAGKATDNVTQKVYMIKDNEKLSNLEVELNQVNEKRTIVFVNTKKSCDTVSRRLDELGYNCTVLHGSKTQDQREQSLQGFREEKYNVLVATDVAGRGIDVPDVALVINYDMPNAIDLYTHRIGRTARAGKAGTAITFLTPQDTDMYYELKKFLEDSKASIPSSLLHHEAAKRPPDAEKSKRETTVYARK